MGHRLNNCKKALTLLNNTPHIQVLKQSTWVETKPVGFTQQKKFMNGACKIKTTLSPLKLLSTLQKIERQLGRKKTFRWGPRCIDLDILVFDHFKMNSKRLTLPHPEIKNRSFILKALKELPQ